MIWAIGVSMIALSALVYLPPRVVNWIGVMALGFAASELKRTRTEWWWSYL